MVVSKNQQTWNLSSGTCVKKIWTRVTFSHQQPSNHVMLLIYPQLDSCKRMSIAQRTEMDITSFISTNVIISVISINVKITLTDFAPTVKVSVTRPNLPLMSGEQVTFFFLMIFRLFSSIVAFIAI